MLTGLAPVATAWLTKLVLDALAGGGDRSVLPGLAAGLAACGLCVIVLPHASTYAQAQLRRAVRALVVDRLFAAVNAHAGLRRLEDPAFQDTLRLAHESSQTAPDRLILGTLAIGQAAITMSGFVGTLLVINPLLVLVIFLAALPSVWIQLGLSRERAHTMWSISPGKRREVFYGELLTRPEAAKEVRLFGLGGYFRFRMLDEVRSTSEAERRIDLKTLRSQGLLALVGSAVAGGGLVWAVLAAASGALTAGDVTVFIAAVAGVQAALTSIVDRWADAHNALLLFGHFTTIVDAEPDPPPNPRPRPVPPLRQGIELRGVWFRYSEAHPWILRGVDLHIPFGQSVALVGVNGAGKSTLVKLLCRLYDPDKGAVLWDGVDLRDLDPAELRERIGAVFQDFMEYDLTASDNILLGDLDSTNEQIAAAAERAGVHETLTALPRGYDTMLSKIFPSDGTGVTLSGGQWQRLALARALLRQDRDLLLLDEPSSGLDADAEHAVHASLRRHRHGRTSVLISHRLGAIRDADLIAVLSEGKIVEQGPHDTLMTLNGEYARLFTLQSSAYTTP
ncbi:ABC transporter ATP-binding protein [Actinomadura madurae]|uniref:ABC transporter ATP-binding protein n=1 Tax=Actinomadura madurae TaxID=1993 RepID=UPI0020D2541C|nr:ABC transporter ATP-binding protein [Actinomadura madurae]MCP9952934.1 ABC transporter ATP-binding protein/permease [Actinomadura madurae]MCP9982152.1 ABC transporter ATP-binding protein/permease [Actinomadura madurae]